MNDHVAETHIGTGSRLAGKATTSKDLGTILVVEDDKSILDGIQQTLYYAGYNVVWGNNGREGLERLEETTPDLILADIMMPVMDGYAFYEALRANPAWHLIPFVFITAKGNSDDIRRGMQLGVDDYLPKPFDMDTLLGVVDTRLRRAQGIRQASHREIDTLKRRMLTMLSHELRTPVTFIKGYADLATLDADKLDGETLSEFLNGINMGSDRLSELVNDLLKVVELETGQSAMIVDSKAQHLHDELGDLLAAVASHFEEAAASADITLEVHSPDALPPFVGVPEHLTEALNRLVENAIKYSQRGTTVEMSAYANNSNVHIEVKDQGRGIRTEELPFIFDYFHQVDRERHEQQGAGLGLAIARGLVELQGGDILVDSQPGEGSTFTILLPTLG